MSFGSRIVQARKDKKMSQEALAKALKATPTTVGRYERDEVKPSIEVAAKIAEVLEVSLDYLIGSSDNYIKDKTMLKRINDILTLNEKDKDHILFTIDAMLRDAKTRQAYS
ncbi:helix-turn-helix transcriptional regulator [Fulvivirga sp. 29W222]|uniref:Helix-turn-helix transcriptional regulator n=1 Tax=Fulvivirga marina TaxID=2494733 RepID=A0A937G017_9BACT|nr:helix-turn-helix transcriptional regulator [Fulvivirga marina]MBL6447636.1 helix-turn-helix transcriptional regulator [Fulvivirga marina]